MLGLDKLVSSKYKKKKLTKDEMIQQMLALPHHHWIKAEPALFRSFKEILGLLQDSTLKFFVENRLYFLKSNGRYACSIDLPQNGPVIVVFPGLLKLLKSAAPNYGLAILAHELGHFLALHGKRSIDPLVAQVEADRFACELGFARELAEIVEEEANSEESAVRMVYLTAHLAKEGKLVA